jgi:dTDP-3-amino-3,4,6-trideoxy-alpha-D-glucose transaminase
VKIPFYNLAAEHEALRPELDAAYRRVMASGWFILGPEVEAFEREFAAYCGADACVGVANGLDALRLALRALGVGPGDEVIVPAHTFVATWLAIADVGATPVPCEPEPGNFAISAAGVETLITRRTRAVLPVHLYGAPAPVEALAKLCQARGMHLVEDAAQAHGARHRGRRCGSFGIAGCFSFYPSKNLGALGDGGAILTSDEGFANHLRRLRNYGAEVKYRVEEAGWNSRLDELHAAFLRVKLARLDEMNARRTALAEIYLQGLADIENVILPKISPDDEPVWHLFVIRTRARHRLRAHLAEAGIESLPFWPLMSHDSVARVCDAIRAFFAR